MGTGAADRAELDDAPAVSSVDDVLELVRARGGRATSSKRILLEVLFEAEGHLSVEDARRSRPGARSPTCTCPRSTGTSRTSRSSA